MSLVSSTCYMCTQLVQYNVVHLYIVLYLLSYMYVCPGVVKVYPDARGTRLVFCDEKSDAFLYNPVTDVSIDIPNYSPSVAGVLWDMAEYEEVQLLSLCV